ncbi:MAG: V-type ATP synthase subunit E [Bacteroidetes bacterium HGW-Bacteroidetes-11]|jgi:V/A-type H+-transporting ATPase subunit E|nr:MAG: V-type ATP synthase subunit E [Bacteroidetes bacterium HGW-Bacteroidetes-11]
MENKLQELTRKIYSEGVEKASQEAAIILENAHKEAEELTKNARKEADEIVKKAQQNAEEIQRNAQSEIRMSSKQAVSALRQQIASLITANVVDAPVKEVISDKAFVGDLIRKALENFDNNAALVLPKADEKALEQYFGSRLSQVMNAGVAVSFDEKIKGGFKIGPKDKSYLISFTDEDFTGFFRSFMRPRTINLLFGE